MRFANPQVAEDLKQGKPLRLDIGSGAKPRAGFYGVDRLDEPIRCRPRPGKAAR
jgi:hypothetical protein